MSSLPSGVDNAARQNALLRAESPWFGIGAVVAVSDLFAEAEAFNRDVRW